MKRIFLKRINCILLIICILFGSLYTTGKAVDNLRKISLIDVDHPTRGNISDDKTLDSEDAITEPYTRHGEIEKRENYTGQNSLKHNRIITGILTSSLPGLMFSFLFDRSDIGAQGQTYTLSVIIMYINNMDGRKRISTSVFANCCVYRD